MKGKYLYDRGLMEDGDRKAKVDIFLKAGAFSLLGIALSLGIYFMCPNDQKKIIVSQQKKAVAFADSSASIDSVVKKEIIKHILKVKEKKLKYNERDYEKMVDEFLDTGKTPILHDYSATYDLEMNDECRGFYDFNKDYVKKFSRTNDSAFAQLYCDVIRKSFPKAWLSNARTAKDDEHPLQKRSWVYLPMVKCGIRFEE